MSLIAAAVMAADKNAFGSKRGIAFALRGDIYLLDPNTSRLPDFGQLKPVGTIYAEMLDVTRRSFREGFPGVTNRFEWFAIDYYGSFKIQRPGRYRFQLTSDDGAKLFIDGQQVIDNDGVHAPRAMESAVDLRRGRHKIRVQYFQGPAAEIALVLELAWEDEEYKLFSTREMGVGKNWLEVLMDTTTLVATLGLLAFMVERLTNGMAMVLGYSGWWKLHMEGSATADPDTRARIDRNRRVALFALSALLAVVGSLFIKLDFLAQLGLQDVPPRAGQIVTGFLIASGADPIRELLKLRDRGREVPQPSQPIQLTGTLVLQQASSPTAGKSEERS